MNAPNNGSSISMPDVPSSLLQLVEDFQTSSYVDVAALIAMLYDIIITWPEEYSLIWKGRWSWGGLLFFLIRYPLAVEGVFYLFFSIDKGSSDAFCVFEENLLIWATLIFLIPLQVILILRTIALWNQSKRIKWFLVVVAVVSDVTMFTALVKAMEAMNDIVDLGLKPLLGCWGIPQDARVDWGIPQDARVDWTIYVCWAAIAAFETSVFVLTFIRALRTCWETRSPLLTVLIRDGFIYYVVMLGISVANLFSVVAMPVNRHGLSVMLSSVMRASFSVVGSRIMLNLRGAQLYARECSDSIDMSGESVQMDRLISAHAQRIHVVELGGC